jgi:hypothetical protein
MNYKSKVEQLYEGFVSDINGDDYNFQETKPFNHITIIKCVDRTLNQLSRVSNQTEKQYTYWNDCIEYLNSL